MENTFKTLIRFCAMLLMAGILTLNVGLAMAIIYCFAFNVIVGIFSAVPLGGLIILGCGGVKDLRQFIRNF